MSYFGANAIGTYAAGGYTNGGEGSVIQRVS